MTKHNPDDTTEQLYHSTIQLPIVFWVAATDSGAVRQVLRHIEINDISQYVPSAYDWDGAQYKVLPNKDGEFDGEEPEIRVLRTLKLHFEKPWDSDLGVAYQIVTDSSTPRDRANPIFWNTAYGLAMLQHRKAGTLQPIYAHGQAHGACCTYLGQYLDRDVHREYDLYYCTQQTPAMLFARYGDTIDSYICDTFSAKPYRYEVLTQAKVWAEEHLVAQKAQKGAGAE